MKTGKNSAAVLLLVLTGFVFAACAKSENAGGAPGAVPQRGGPAPATVFSVRTEESLLRTLQAYIEVNADIVSSNQVAVIPDAAGRLVSMQVQLGSQVRQGQLIAQVDPSRPGSLYSLSPVPSPVSGMVVSNPVSVGSTVTTGTVLMTIAVGGSIEIKALIPEREVGQLDTGLSAEIRLEAFPGEVFAATVTQVSPVLDPVSRTKQITMQFGQRDPRISSGMFARVKLNTRTYENVISIPEEALAENRGTTVVYVLPQGTQNVEMREVSPGVNVDGEVEIKSGLEPGEAVVVQGQQFLTDKAAVRVVGGGQ